MGAMLNTWNRKKQAVSEECDAAEACQRQRKLEANVGRDKR